MHNFNKSDIANIKQTISSNVRAERTRKKMTQENLANEIKKFDAEISTTALSCIENSKRLPHTMTLVYIARGLNIDVKKLLEGVR